MRHSLSQLAKLRKLTFYAFAYGAGYTVNNPFWLRHQRVHYKHVRSWEDGQ